MHDNTPSHSARATQVFLAFLGIQVWSGPVEVRPSLGLWLRCSIFPRKKGIAGSQHCGVYATTGADLPTAQVVAMASLVTGTGIAVLATLLVLTSACCRVVAHKSLFNITGSVQALAGVFCVLGLVVFPLSWSSVRVQLMCGPLAGPYVLGACSSGEMIGCPAPPAPQVR
ncbi:Lipoma HMGIC fusion partner-like protein [Trinorchestia longiramus]|nr:Lipoma HMGIC fusion partner-like protein [Trinorchestia longiramus]